MGAQVSYPADVHVVVVGGGFGGIAAAQNLKSKNIRFTLIDTRDAFHHNVAALRAAVQPGFAKRTFIPYRETFGDSFIQGKVRRVDTHTHTVTVEGGQEIHYSHLILCTGTDGAFPGKFNTVTTLQEAIHTYEDFVKEVQAAASVLVIGGGSTGVEMAAEIKTEYPEKKVVLIHSRTDLADRQLLSSVRLQIKEILLEKGVELMLGQKVCELSSLRCNVCVKEQSVKTDRGQILNTDLIINCCGLNVNSAAYSSGLSECMAADSSLMVNEHLQVTGHANVYAVGDCANVSEPKMAYHASLHAAVAVSNVINSLSGKHLTTYNTGNVTMLLALGRSDGAGQFNGYRLPRSVVTLGKSRDLLLWKSWREMQQTQPS